jgi:hypothetical protein
LKKLCEVLTVVWADRVIFVSTENFGNFAKVSYFRGRFSFFHVFIEKIATKLEFSAHELKI